MLTNDPEANRVVEKEFARWAKAVGLAHKLRTMSVGQCESGECGPGRQDACPTRGLSFSAAS
jgi:hypothetical protein